MHSGGVRLSLQHGGKPTMYDYKPAKEILDLMSAGPKHAERDVENYFRKYQLNPDDKTPAFDALVEILCAAQAVASEDGDRDPHRKFTLDLWIAEALASGMEAFRKDPVRGLSLEQRLGLRSSKSGGHSEIAKGETQMKLMHVALEVGYCRGPDPAHGDTEKAKNIVAEKLGETSGYVKDAWEAYKNGMLLVLEYHRVWERLNQEEKHP
jgi:hypothetical protein